MYLRFSHCAHQASWIKTRLTCLMGFSIFTESIGRDVRGCFLMSSCCNFFKGEGYILLVKRCFLKLPWKKKEKKKKKIAAAAWPNILNLHRVIVRWQITCGRWHVRHDTWHVIHDIWQKTIFFLLSFFLHKIMVFLYTIHERWEIQGLKKEMFLLLFLPIVYCTSISGDL